MTPLQDNVTIAAVAGAAMFGLRHYGPAMLKIAKSVFGGRSVPTTPSDVVFDNAAASFMQSHIAKLETRIENAEAMIAALREELQKQRARRHASEDYAIGLAGYNQYLMDILTARGIPFEPCKVAPPKVKDQNPSDSGTPIQFSMQGIEPEKAT